FRDGMHQSAVHSGVAPYKPNSLDGGNPASAAGDHSLNDIPQPVTESARQRRSPASFEDHFSQARMFWLSLSDIERQHLAEAFIFELGKCYEETIRKRQLRVLAAVDAQLCAKVAQGLGLEPPQETAPAEVEPSPALSQIGKQWPIAGR